MSRERARGLDGYPVVARGAARLWGTRGGRCR